MTKTPPNTLHLICSLEVGGAEKLLIAFLEAALKHDFQNIAVLVMNDEVSPQLKSQMLALDLPAYFLNRVRSHKHPRYLLILLQIIWRHKIQVIHVHDYGSKLWAALCKAVFPWLKLVFTIHDTWTVSNFNGANRLLHRHWINQNIAISRAVQQECRLQNIHNATLVPNGVDIARFASKPMENRNNTGCFRILQVARLEPETKGQDILIHALKRCRDNGLHFTCQLVGTLTEETYPAYESLQTLCHQLDLSDCISFVTDCADVSTLLPDNDLFILPSRLEGFGLVIVEAMAARLPVIVSNIDAPKEIVKDGINGLHFENENPVDLADKIMTLYHSRAMRERLSTEGFKTAQSFDISVMLKRYKALYQSLTA